MNYKNWTALKAIPGTALAGALTYAAYVNEPNIAQTPRLVILALFGIVTLMGIVVLLERAKELVY